MSAEQGPMITRNLLSFPVNKLLPLIISDFADNFLILKASLDCQKFSDLFSSNLNLLQEAPSYIIIAGNRLKKIPLKTANF